MSTSLPISRIKTIMKSSPEVEVISHDSALLVGKATELFIGFLTTEACERGKGKKLDYKDLADVVQTDDRLDFLREMVPKKITVREFKDILKRKKKMVDKGAKSSGETTPAGSEDSETDSEDSEKSSLSDAS